MLYRLNFKTLFLWTKKLSEIRTNLKCENRVYILPSEHTNRQVETLLLMYISCFIIDLKHPTEALILSFIDLVFVITWFRVQFGVNKHEQIFQRQQNCTKAWRTLCSLYSGSSYNFDSSYIRMHSFSANQKREIFSCTLLNPKLSLIVRFFLGILSGGQCNVLCFNGGTCNKDNCTCKNGFTGKFCQSRM